MSNRETSPDRSERRAPSAPLRCAIGLLPSLLWLGGCAEEDAHAWSYEGDTGPDHWGELSDAWSSCSEGEAQSPIALRSDLAVEDLSDLALHYGESAVSIENNGHTIQYHYDPGSSVEIGGAHYDLVQFHFHAHSEHTIDGRTFPMELHLVHADASGRLAVLGVFIESGAADPTLEDAGWRSLPAEHHTEFDDEELRFSAEELVPGGLTYRYSGSLTTPPCSEGVDFYLFAEPITLSAAQIAVFTALYDHNHRPVQAEHGRVVRLGQ